MIPADLLALLFHMQGIDTKRRKGEPSPLRADVPAISPAPDRAKWEADHGRKPYRLTEGKPPSLPLLSSVKLIVFAHRARRCIERDLATLDRDKAIGESVKLAHIRE